MLLFSLVRVNHVGNMQLTVDLNRSGCLIHFSCIVISRCCGEHRPMTVKTSPHITHQRYANDEQSFHQVALVDMIDNWIAFTKAWNVFYTRCQGELERSPTGGESHYRLMGLGLLRVAMGLGFEVTTALPRTYESRNAQLKNRTCA